MIFQVGDKVIHLVHGIGDIVDIENRTVQEDKVSCFVVQTQDLTIWVPINEADQHSIRSPAPETEFEAMFSILEGPNQPLPEDRIERKQLLMGLLDDGNLSSIGRVVRDLFSLSQERKLSEEDKTILERAENTLLVEWGYSLAVPRSQALAKMRQLLQSETAPS